MDIGDPSDIPATRRRLPSMHELGAFDTDVGDEPAAAAAPAGSPGQGAGAAQPVQAAPAADASVPTPAQLRRAMAGADPGTRRRLIRLFGRAPAAHEADPANGEAGNTLLRLDEQTELLGPRPAAAERPAAQHQPARSDGPPHKTAQRHNPRVLFPLYDPDEHGPDLRTPRRVAAPVEGHFPPPRQPYGAGGQEAPRDKPPRPDRPERMPPAHALTGSPEPSDVADAEPATAPAVEASPGSQSSLPAPSENARALDRVNGLLLSRRDLADAVQEGLLPTDTAALLWQIWSARRPVIHVLDDPPAAPPAADRDEGCSKASPEDMPPGLSTCVADDPEPPSAQHPAASATPGVGGLHRADGAMGTRGANATNESDRVAGIDAAVAAPHSRRAVAVARGAAWDSRSGRAAWLARQVWRTVVAACVLSTAARVTLWAWPHARPWFGS